MDGWMNEWRDRWIEGWIDRYVCPCVKRERAGDEYMDGGCLDR